MRQTKSLRNFLLFSCSLLLFACAGTPAQHPQLFDNVFRTPEPTAVPGSLLDAEALDVIPAKNTQQVLAVASPFVIGTQLKMGVLDNAGYAAWRQSRLGTLRDIQPIRSSHQFLGLVLNDPAFAWLRVLSQLVVLIDETVEAKETPSSAEANRLVRQVRELLSPVDPSGAFESRYLETLQRDPDAVLAHAAAMEVLRRLE